MNMATDSLGRDCTAFKQSKRNGSMGGSFGAPLETKDEG